MASSTGTTAVVSITTPPTHGKYYVLVVIDTNMHVFLEDLICKKENGGLQAGRRLMKVFCQMYPLVMNVILVILMDKEGLVGRHRRALITLTPTMLQSFLAGFRQQSLQAFIRNPGPRGQYKVRFFNSYFDRHLLNVNCREVHLGCWIRNTEGMLGHQTAQAPTLQQISLIQSAETIDDISLAPFPKISFSNIFRRNIAADRERDPRPVEIENLDVSWTSDRAESLDRCGSERVVPIGYGTEVRTRGAMICKRERQMAFSILF